MYWMLYIIGGIILVMFLLNRIVKYNRQDRKSNLPITDISILQNRFKDEKWEFLSLKPVIMTVLSYIRPNGGSMSFFPYGEVNTINGAPNEVKNYVLELLKENKQIPNYIVLSTFFPSTKVGPYLMLDFYSKKYDKTFSAGFLNQKCGFDLRNMEQANMFFEYIKNELIKLQ